MAENNSQQQQSQLIAVLREGIGVIQMILFKELRNSFAKRYPDSESSYRSMLAGAIINTLFGQDNPEEKFQRFNRENRAEIEQELIGFPTNFSALRTHLTDALRVQALCDSQEGIDTTAPLKQAEELGILVMERDVPLPSTFMTLVRGLGEMHGLTVAPVPITPEDDQSLPH